MESFNEEERGTHNRILKKIINIEMEKPWVSVSHAACAMIVQMWDLRYATAPMRTLERHKRGILSLAWCPQDSDLLLSASKDNCVLCWNPNSDVPGGEVGVSSE